MNSREPVAMRYDFDGYGYMYIDSGSGSDWKTRKKGEFLYAHPPIAFAELEEGQSIPLYEHPMRELSDEEIDNIFGICALNTTVTLTTEQCYWIVDAILKKASEG